jgi:hypothetical protein
MKQSVMSLFVVIATTAAFNVPAGAATTTPTLVVKQAAPAPYDPAAESEKAAEEELTLQGMPDILNRPER